MRKLLLLAAFMTTIGFSANAARMIVEGETVDVPVCGGFLGLVCGEDEWCDYPENTICGDVDQFGVCRKRPEICIKVYLPVCGCDGETYGNACEAAAGGTDVAYPGACQSSAR